MMKASLILLLASAAFCLDKASAAMSEVVWNTTTTNEATIEFCEESGDIYGYRLPGETSCGPAGVVVRMQPGTNYKMTLKNTASVPTNVHTHGLHISGDGDADDATRVVDPNMCLIYHWDIPGDHMGGTFWMHAHVHGTTDLQVSGGAFAMVIIEDNTPVIDDSVTSDPSIDTTGVEAWLDRSNEILLLASKDGTARLGNGESNLVIDMFAEEWYRMRVAAVDAGGRNSDLTFSGNCDVHAAAHDGVWRHEVPKTTPQLTYSLTGESRLDVAIRCRLNQGGTVSWARRDVATLNVTVGTTSTATPFITNTGTGVQGPWKSHRPYYLEDLRIAPFDTMTETYSISMSAAQINGVSWDEHIPLRDFAYGADENQKWGISGTGAHPFHMHVYHMQTIGCADHDEGEYYDTISTNGDCEVRFRITDYGQRIMMHCHVLSHEDNGAMTWVDVTDTTGAMPIQSTADREQDVCPGDPVPPPSPGGCTEVGDPCVSGGDCCSGSCSGGKPSSRVCLAARRLRG